MKKSIIMIFISLLFYQCTQIKIYDSLNYKKKVLIKKELLLLKKEIKLLRKELQLLDLEPQGDLDPFKEILLLKKEIQILKEKQKQLMLKKKWTKFTEYAITPMKGANIPEPFSVSANSQYSSSYPAWHAFDNSKKWTAWISGHISAPLKKPAIIEYKFDKPTRVIKYIIRGRKDHLKDRLPKNWLLQGSNIETASVKDSLTDEKWDTLDKKENIDINHHWKTVNHFMAVQFYIKNRTAYKKYRLCITAVNGSTVVDIMEIEFYK